MKGINLTCKRERERRNYGEYSHDILMGENPYPLHNLRINAVIHEPKLIPMVEATL